MNDSIRQIACCFLVFSGILLMSCEKNELDPDTPGSPVLYVQGTMNGIDLLWTAGESESMVVSQNNINTLPPSFSFYMLDSNMNGSAYASIRFTFISYSDSMTSLNTALDSTFIQGPKEFAPFFPSPVNPLNLNTVLIEFQDSTGMYYPVPDSGLVVNANFFIDSTRNMIWKDGNPYTLVYLHFECPLYLFNTPGMGLPFTDGKAVLAFRRD